MENRIKEQQLMLFSDRTTCQTFVANQFRLLISSFVYALVDALRRLTLKGTPWATAQSDAIRLKLIKVAARVRITARRIIFHLSSSYPWQPLFRLVLHRLLAPD